MHKIDFGISSTKYSIKNTSGNASLRWKAVKYVTGIAKSQRQIRSYLAPVTESPPERNTAQTMVYGILRIANSRPYIIAKTLAIETVFDVMLPLRLKMLITLIKTF